MKGQSKFISSTYLPDNAKLVKPSKMLRVDANAILDYWWDRQETQVGLTFRFKAWMDVKGRMHSPVAKDSDGDANDESPRTRPTRKPSATTTSSLTSIPNGWLTSNKRPHDSSIEDESDKTRAEASPPVVKQRHHGHTDAEVTYMPDDQPVPKSVGTHARGQEDQSPVSHQQKPPTAKPLFLLVICQLKLAAEPIPLAQVQLSRAQALRRTRAAQDVSLVVQETQAKKVTAPRECLPRKAKSAKLAAGGPSDAPAKGTRSKADNSRAIRTREMRYADYN
ncbi:hypothetical protein EV702DRAFT_1199576 [Suillus placidus]|uniref:Uncharacterized protein n=1 Tax=Suillus placidus TaxID=48579 RepID=A0A9P6ZS40_9AGAM|nr:hypothetical protein EV702DRAFT_1199576 [Suillus placidus]